MKNKIYNYEEPYLHIYAKYHQKSWPAPSLYEAWMVFDEVLSYIQEEAPITTISFVMMRNHYHWLCQYDHKSDPGMADWFHELIRTVFLKYADISNFFEYSPNIEIINNIKHFREVYRYIYRNPIEAGVVTKAEEYLYSTLPYKLGQMEEVPSFSFYDNMNLITHPKNVLYWINSKSNEMFH